MLTLFGFGHCINKPTNVPEMNDTEWNQPAEIIERSVQKKVADKPRPREVGGRKGPEPTRYGDWEKNGRCIDF